MFSIKSDLCIVICNWLTQYLGNVIKYQKSKKKINGRRQFTNEIIHIQLCSNLIEILKGLSRLF